ncbi:hypothetical protein JHK86_018946 [Glycine max]|nr:hypothetical protein JHK86_018946 [Glycine max]
MLFSPALDDAKHGFSWPEMYKENLAGTLEAYDRHVFLCYKSHLAWPPRLEAFDADALPLRVATVWRARKNDITVKRNWFITPTRVETPNVIDLRKQQRKEPKKPLYQVLEEKKEKIAPGTLLGTTHTYEDAREEKKLRNKCEDSSDMVAEVVGAAIIFEVQRSSRSEARKEELRRREIQVVFLP